MKVAVFASYARSNQEEGLEKFIAALRHELSLKPSVVNAAPTVLFFDDEALRVGHDWEQVLCSSVSSAETLLCLMSDWYFEREWCGRELGAFVTRKRQLPPEAVGAQFIFPLWWMPSKARVPSVLLALQYKDRTFPEAYRSRGIRGLLRGRNAQGDFEDLVTAIADCIAETIECPHSLPHGAPVQRVEEFENGFEEQQPFDVRMVVFADGGTAWRPTAEDRSVAEAAALVRTRTGAFVRTVETGVHMERDCRQAQAEKQVILVVVEADAIPPAKVLRVNGFGLPNVVWLVVEAGEVTLDKATWQAGLNGTVYFAGPGELAPQMELLVGQTRRSLEALEQARTASDDRLTAGAPDNVPLLSGPGQGSGR